jgi:hypothetical protein
MIHLSKVTVLFYVVLSLFATHSIAQEKSIKPDSLLVEGRKLFALSIEDKVHVQPSIDLFEKIIADRGNLHDQALVYLGALYTIKAKYTFFPFSKLKWAKKGLCIMDEALSRAPEDIEVLFVHGTICHNLPGLFNRQDDARRDFNKIIELLPDNLHRYDEDFIADVLEYLGNEISLTKKDQMVITKINSELSIAAGEVE